MENANIPPEENNLLLGNDDGEDDNADALMELILEFQVNYNKKS